jgi:hypothetical protein
MGEWEVGDPQLGVHVAGVHLRRDPGGPGEAVLVRPELLTTSCHLFSIEESLQDYFEGRYLLLVAS